MYAYVANNPTTWVDPSGHTAAFSDLSPNQQKVLAALIVSAPLLFLALPAAIAGVFLYIACVLEGECRTYLNEAWALIEELGSDGSNDKKWDLDALVDAYQQWPLRPVLERPFRQMYSMVLGNLPGLGDLYDLHVAMTGYDPVTGEHLGYWARLLTGMAVLPLPFLTGQNLRAGREGVEFAVENVDDVARVERNLCSFAAETPVVTTHGPVAISEVAIGDKVLAWNEATDATGYYTVTNAYSDVHEVLVYLTIDDEVVETTPEHPFYTAESGWIPAGELVVGTAVRKIDGTTGVIAAITFDATPRAMYNMTVAVAHTYVVGDGEWVVHNHCGSEHRNED